MADIKGTFRVTKIKALGSNIQYQAFFLKNKVLFVKIGGQFADGGIGGAVGGGIGGAIGAGIGALIDAAAKKSSDKNKEKKIKSLVDMSEDELIRLDKHNYALPYEEIFKIQMKKSSFSMESPRIGKIVFEGKKKEQFNLCINQKYEDCENVIKSLLPSKLI